MWKEITPCIFHSSGTLLCFAFRLLFFFLALDTGLSNVAKPYLDLRLFRQLALGRLLPTWPSHCGPIPVFCGAFLLISH